MPDIFDKLKDGISFSQSETNAMLASLAMTNLAYSQALLAATCRLISLLEKEKLPEVLLSEYYDIANRHFEELSVNMASRYGQ
ncbi:MAG: hypothetical protein KF749_04350 [Bacteroidetes bacterium]|nr:hypothetical protein [Bacteroidota bacterium]MCW5897608.1 hypothetical protein [Bacteroidota bacterium]